MYVGFYNVPGDIFLQFLFSKNTQCFIETYFYDHVDSSWLFERKEVGALHCSLWKYLLVDSVFPNASLLI